MPAFRRTPRLHDHDEDRRRHLDVIAGCATGPGADLEHGLGVGRRSEPRPGDGHRQSGGCLDPSSGVDETGAIVMGRRRFGFVDGTQRIERRNGAWRRPDQATSGPRSWCRPTTHRRRAGRVRGSASRPIWRTRSPRIGMPPATRPSSSWAVRRSCGCALRPRRRATHPPLAGGGRRRLDAVHPGSDPVALHRRDVVVPPHGTRLRHAIDT